MNKIYFAYDKKVKKNPKKLFKYVFNTYDNQFYPINGIWEECYYDYHAPIQTVFEKNGIPTKSITIHEALYSSKKFVYVLTFRYLGATILNEQKKHGFIEISKNYNLFEHLSIELIDAVNSGQCLLVLNDAHESNYYNDKFYLLLKDKLSRAGINFKNVVVLTGNVNNKDVDNDIKIVFWQYFETAMRLSYEKTISVNRQRGNTNLKKFLCLNRIARETRYYFMFKIWQKGLLPEFNASLKNVGSIEEITSYNNNIFMKDIKSDPDFHKMLKTLPWIIDTDNFKDNHWDKVDFDFSGNSLIFVTTETLFSPDLDNLFLTEKTFKPILLKMPFIVIGNPHILKRLRSLGYKTFDSLWDENYDEEFDCQRRMEKIINLVEDISKKYSTQELKKLLEKNKHITEHNFDLLMQRRPEQAVIDFIKEKV